MGIPAFAILYVPPFLCFQYVVFKTDFGATLAASLPWWELILASMYRVPMELPLQYPRPRRNLPLRTTRRLGMSTSWPRRRRGPPPRKTSTG